MANQPKKYKKFVATAATATLVASAIVPVASAASLSDIAGNTHEAAITSLVDAGIINGYADGTFKPNKTLTRSDVVKLLGKYLVSEGYSIPSDAVTSPRFSDLTSKSNKELLEYAAVVADAGVFAGSNGKLLAGDPITRENMAIVLVRMVNTLKDANLEAFVASQKFDREVKDLNSAKAEARTAIDVLDFYDITTATNFLPKNTVTRGQFATFLNNVIKADFTGASVTSGTVKAINNTTVEVTFAEEVKDLAALNFGIEGLTISGKVLKQTDKKTVVLTTSAQTAGVEYTVTVDGEAVGKFVGLAEVIPTKITTTTTSLQGVIGEQVTVKAQVTVAEGQSKANIPVTFNVVNNQTNTNDKIEVQVLTNAEGVASYSYTRYYASEDNVTAYATKKSSVYDAAKVYWANKIQLAVSEITTGNDLANEAKKSYKVTGAPSSTYYIAIKENLNVTPDKLTDVKVQNHGTLNFVTPYELTTGGTPQFATVTTNANGEGTFTVYGSNLSATPIVYKPESTPTTPATFTYNKLDLQAEAPTVKFSQVDRLKVEVKAEGTADAAEYNTVPSTYNGNSIGGRSYTVTVTDKDGKIAPEGTIAYVTFKTGNISGDVYFTTAKETFKKVVAGDVLPIRVGKEGKATFRVAGKGATTYVKPTVFLNTAGTVTPVKLDTADVQQDSEITYFKSPVVVNATLTVKNAAGNVITTQLAGQDAIFEYQSVDQNGFAYKPTRVTNPASTTTGFVQEVQPDGSVRWLPISIENRATFVNNFTLAFDVSSNFANAIVKDQNGVTLNAIQNLGSTKTYHVTSDNDGLAKIYVTSQVSDTVVVNATGASNILPTASASVTFTQYASLADVSGTVASVNKTKKEFVLLTTNNKTNLYNYAVTGAVYQQYGSSIPFSAFEALLNTGAKVNVTFKDGVYTFNVIEVGGAFTRPSSAQDQLDLDIAIGALTGDPVNIDAILNANRTANLTIANQGDVTVDITNAVTGYTGTLTVNLPNGHVNNAGTINVVNILDVSTSSFVNTGTVGNVFIKDVNGARFVNNGTINGLVTIDVAGAITLGGNLAGKVIVNKAATITAETGAVLTGLVATVAGVTVGGVAQTVTNEIPFTVTTTSGDTVTLSFTANVTTAEVANITFASTADTATVAQGNVATTLTITVAGSDIKTKAFELTYKGLRYAVAYNTTSNTWTVTRK